MPARTTRRRTDASSVCLFSGGLDSFIGAIDLLGADERPLLVSHYWDGVTSQHQGQCFAALETRFPDAELTQLRARVGFPKDLVVDSQAEDTLRARSFMFFALAALAASALGDQTTIHVPENGFISLNVPIDPLRLGANSTRTTHPYYMARFNELLDALDISARLVNRYRHMTKGQMAVACVDRDWLAAQAHITMSCSSPTKARWVHREPTHCGYCVPCIIRRAALLHGFGRDNTPYVLANLSHQVLNTNKAEGAHVRSFQFAIARLAQAPERARLDIHRPGPLIDHPDDFEAYRAVYVAGLDEVARFLNGVRARPQ